MNISTTMIAVSLPTELLNRLKELAAKQNSPLDNVISRAVNEYVGSQTGAKPL